MKRPRLMFVSLFGFVLIGNADLGEMRGAKGGRKKWGGRKKTGVCAESTLFGLFRSDPSVLWQNESPERSGRRETASERSTFGLRHFNDPGVQMRGLL